MLKYILTAIFLLLVWAAFLVFALPLWIPCVVSGAAIALLVLIVVLRSLRNRKAAKQIEGAINSQADADAASLHPEQAAEIRALQAEFNRSLESLKSSRLARKGGKNALAALPWYVIIGPPGAGKSTALRNSGLKFPNLSGSGRGGGIKGVGGTRNCEWWLTNEAIILDTAGRYTTEEDDRDEWFAFLDMLKRARPSRPVNGVIAAISITDLVSASVDEVVDRARQIRERIDELMDRVQIVVPVYVLLTKCDLVAGFIETFGELRKSERAQVWGFTVPLADAGLDPAEIFLDHFDELSGVLDQRAIGRMAEARNPETRERVYGFPQQFAALRDNLCEFTSQLFLENVYQETPILRGVYFTSGTQEGRAIDRVMARMAEAFGVRERLASEPAATDAKSYFLHDVMADVVFPDRDVAFRNRKDMRRAALLRWLAAGSAAALAAGFLGLGLYSYLNNRELVNSTVAVVQKANSRSENGELSLEDIEPLGRKVAELHEHEQHGAPWRLRFGMYQGEKLYTALRGSYASAIRRTIFEPVLAQDLDDMNDFSSRYQKSGAAPDAKDYVGVFDKLKMHLLLSRPREEGEPGLGANEQSWIIEHIAARSRTAAKKSSLEPMTIFLRLMADDPSLSVARSDDVVRKTRQVLRRTRMEKFILDKMIADLNRDEYNMGLPEIIGYGISTLESSEHIRGAFTRKAWEKRVRLRLARASEPEDKWVLGKEEASAPGQENEEQVALLRTQYFKQYRDEWRHLIESIHLKPASNGTEALAMLQELTDSKPLAVLAAEVARNTHLEDLTAEITERANGLANKVRQKLGIEPDELLPKGPPKPGDDRVLTGQDVEAYFADFVKFAIAPKKEKDEADTKKLPPLDVFQEHLEYVRDDLKTYLDGDGKDPGPVENRLKVARLRLESLLAAAGSLWRPHYARLLTPTLDITSDAVKGVGGGAANSKWCAEIALPYGEAVGHRYPFNKTATDDVQLSTFVQYYAPGSGKIWKYYDSDLASKIGRVDDRFALKEKATVFGQGLITFLNRSQAITSAVFPANSSQPAVNFAVQVTGSPGVAEIGLDVEGQRVIYRNGPLEWRSLHWPGDGKKTGAVLRAKGTGIDETLASDGEWGLFRLLDQATLRAESPAPSFSATWSLKNHTVDIKIVFRPTQRENPFVDAHDGSPHPQLLRSFRSKEVLPPSSIAKGAKCE